MNINLNEKNNLIGFLEKNKYNVSKSFLKRNLPQLEKSFDCFINLKTKSVLDFFILDLIYVDYNKNKLEFIEKDFMDFLCLFEEETIKGYLLKRNNIRGITLISSYLEKNSYKNQIFSTIVLSNRLEKNEINQKLFLETSVNLPDNNSKYSFLNKDINIPLEKAILTFFNISECVIEFIQEKKNSFEIFIRKYNKSSITLREWKYLKHYFLNLDPRITNEKIKISHEKNIIKILK